MYWGFYLEIKWKLRDRGVCYTCLVDTLKNSWTDTVGQMYTRVLSPVPSFKVELTSSTGPPSSVLTTTSTKAEYEYDTTQTNEHTRDGRVLLLHFKVLL